MKLERKHIIIAGIGLFTISGATLYWQYTKLMGYKIKPQKVFVNKISLTDLDMNVYLGFDNTSSLKFTIKSQSYSAYMNGVFIGSAVNAAPQNIVPGPDNVIGVNVKLNPKSAFNTLHTNALDLLTKPENVKIKLVINLSVSIFKIPLNLPIMYEATLKDMMAGKKKATA